MATRFDFQPGAARPATSNGARLTIVNNRLVLSFSGTTSEAAFWEFVAPQGITGTITLIVSYAMSSATSGGIVFGAALEAVTPGDALNVTTTDSFDTESTQSDTVPASAGNLDQFTITISNTDGIAAGDRCRLRLQRLPADAGDTASTGECYVYGAELRDAA